MALRFYSKTRRFHIKRTSRISGIKQRKWISLHPKHVWLFHKGDADFFPSVPHGHDGKLKLSTVNGAIYNAHGEKVDHISSKDMKRLKTNPKFKKFAIEHIQWYRASYPNTGISVPDWLDLEMELKSALLRPSKSGATTFLFVTEAKHVVQRGMFHGHR